MPTIQFRTDLHGGLPFELKLPRYSEASSAEHTSTVMGVFKKYANPSLIPREKDAWGDAARKKHATL
ncbi:MAG: hypothetical protein FWG42_10225 [Clostridiales bacterium]|nr:hypothetical protein [Clostridiales bacterium]